MYPPRHPGLDPESREKPAIAGFFIVCRGLPGGKFLSFYGKKKGAKENSAPYRIASQSPALLAKPGGGLNSRYALRQRPPTTPVLAVLLGAAAGELDGSSPLLVAFTPIAVLA